MTSCLQLKFTLAAIVMLSTYAKDVNQILVITKAIESVGIVASVAPTRAGIELTDISLAAAASVRNKIGLGLYDSMTGSLAGAHSVTTGMSPDRLVETPTSGWPPPTTGTPLGDNLGSAQLVKFPEPPPHPTPTPIGVLYSGHMLTATI